MKILIILLMAFALHGQERADTTKSAPKLTVKNLSSQEKMLAGFLLLYESYSMAPEKLHGHYTALLKECGLTHAQFQSYLKSQKQSLEKWKHTIERINSALGSPNVR